jgi:hypothetical protein
MKIEAQNSQIMTHKEYKYAKEMDPCNAQSDTVVLGGWTSQE